MEDENASRNHRQAERRRRERINAQFTALRKLIPKSDKMDKAGLLGQVVDLVREQSRIANDLSGFRCTIPTEMDRVTVEQEETGSLIRVSICCEDRADLFANLNTAMKSLGLIVEAGEITGAGRRIRSSFLLRSEQQQKQDPSLFNQSLKSTLNRVLFISSVSGMNYIAGSKRSRFFQPS